MQLLAQTIPYRSVLKSTSTTEGVIFIVLLLAAVMAVVIRVGILRKRDRRQSAHALLMTCIHSNHLNQEEAEMLRRLVAGRNTRQILKNPENFLHAVEAYLATSGTDPEQLAGERARFALLTKHIHFRQHGNITASALPEGGRVKVWLRGRGLFSAVIEANTRKGVWIGLPHWAMPAGMIKKKQEMVVYYWDQHHDYEIHGYIARLRGARLFMPHSSTVFQGRHPGGMNVEARIPVFFQRILDLDLPKKEKPQLHILQGTIVSLSVIGAEIITRVKSSPGSLYRFEFDTESGGRKKHWFIGRVTESEKEEVGNRVFIRFMDIRDRTRELIERFVCRRVNRGGVSTLPSPLPVSEGMGRISDSHP